MSDADRSKASPDIDKRGRSGSTGDKPRARTKGNKADDVGSALRSAYDAALSEDIPDDFLDLLGKLD